MLSARELLPIALQAVSEVAPLLRDRPTGARIAKGERDYAFELDLRVERRLRELLHERTPSIPVLGEEEGRTGGAAADRLLWTVDPVDGTVNYGRGLPLCGIALGLAVDRRPVLGVIDLPFLGARYQAVEGGGAEVSGRPIRCRTASRLEEAVVAIGDFAVAAGGARAVRNRRYLALLERISARALRIRMLGSAAVDLVWLAEGRIDASVTLANNPWDMCAGVAIAREAGAVVADLDGSGYSLDAGATLAAPPGLFEELRAMVGESVRAADGDPG
jgi:myo-inositol-1(or 4)-monophosphatase